MGRKEYKASHTGYFCPKCMKFVLVEMGGFLHPHRGEERCLICRKCGKPVYAKEQNYNPGGVK